VRYEIVDQVPANENICPAQNKDALKTTRSVLAIDDVVTAILRHDKSIFDAARQQSAHD
jgi:hypothetical protein